MEKIYIYFTTEFFVTVEYFIPKSDLFTHERYNNITVIEMDWKNYTALVSEEFSIQVGFEAWVNKSSMKIEDIEYFVSELLPFFSGGRSEERRVGIEWRREVVEVDERRK